MRILILAPMLPQERGAGAIPLLLHAQLTGLARHHEVTFVTGIGDEPGEAEAARALEQSGIAVHVVDRTQPAGFPQRWRRRWRLASTWGAGWYPWRTVWFAAPKIQDILDRLAAFDIVAVEDNAMAMYRLPKAAGTLLTEYEVRTPRSFDWHPGKPREWPHWLFRELDWRRWAQFQRRAWRRFDRVQVFTQRDAQLIRRLAPDVGARVRVNPFGFVVPPPADPAREQDGLVLFVGNFTHYPNRDAARWLAHEIMPAVWLRHPDAHLRIVGTAPTAEIRELASARIDVVGNAGDMAGHLAEASVVAAPVRTGGGMRVKVLEALASGKAVVTTTRGAEGYEFDGEEPPFLFADSARDIAASIAACLNDPDQRRSLGRRGRQFVLQHHSEEAWARRLGAVFAEAIANDA